MMTIFKKIDQNGELQRKRKEKTKKNHSGIFKIRTKIQELKICNTYNQLFGFNKKLDTAERKNGLDWQVERQ